MTNPNWTAVKAVPAARSKRSTLKLRVAIIVGAVLFAAVAGPLALLLSLGGGGGSTAISTTGNGAATALAQRALDDYLAGRPLTVPVASNVKDVFGSDQGKPTGLSVLSVAHIDATPLDYTKGDKSQPYQLDRFQVVTTTATYIVTVTTSITARGPLLAAAPMFAPYVPTPDTETLTLDYAGLDSVPLNDTTRQRVQDWATWFTSTSDDAARQLKAITGDRDAARTYVPLAGFTLVPDRSPRIVAAIPDGQTAAGESRLYLRVVLWLRPVGADGTSLVNEYDLLVLNPDSGTPSVVAWGPAGAESLIPWETNGVRP
jgi:hypothetical protein